MLDRTERRIVGVLIEKERTVPDTYPLSEKALVAGCNQTNNRDPMLDLQGFEVAGALMALQQKGWLVRVDGGSRVTKYRHKIVEHLGLTDPEVAVMAELLLRGPQAPGALKTRVARLGFHAEPTAILEVLEKLRSRPQPLVEQLARVPRERDGRWQHLLGEDAQPSKPAFAAVLPTGLPSASSTGVPTGVSEAQTAPDADPVPPPSALAAPRPVATASSELERRVLALEREVAELRAELRQRGSGGQALS